MKVMIKELAWKVPICVAWIQCTPWINDKSLTFLEQCIICFLFILSLDLIRWGLKKEYEPADKEEKDAQSKDIIEALRTEYEKGRADVIADTLSWLGNCWPRYCSNQTIIEGFKEAIKYD